MQKRSLVSEKGLETSSQVSCLLRSDGQQSLCVSHAQKTGHLGMLLLKETLSGPLSLTNKLQQGLLPFTLLAEVPQRIFSRVPLAKIGSNVPPKSAMAKGLRQL